MAVVIVEDLIGSSSFSSDAAPGNAQHTVVRPASATMGMFVTVEIAVSTPGANITPTITTVPAGWGLIASGAKAGTPTASGFVYGKFMEAGEPSSWTWAYTPASNVLSHIHVHSGVDTLLPVVEAGHLPQAPSNSSRITPTLTLAASRLVRYGTHDRNASDPAVPSPDTATKLRSFQPSNTSLASANAGTLPAGSFVRTFTGAAATSVAGSFAYALNPASEVEAVEVGGAVTVTIAAQGIASQENTATGSVTVGATLTAETMKVGVATGELTIAVATTGQVPTAIQRWLTTRPLLVAHRLFGGNFVELSLDAAERAVAWGAKALGRSRGERKLSSCRCGGPPTACGLPPTITTPSA